MKAGIIGGTGYTGRELIKILLKHKDISAIDVYGRRSGAPLYEDIPEIRGIFDSNVKEIDPVTISNDCDIIFMALPHKISMDYMPLFNSSKRLIIDLSADYRLTTPEDYEKWYGTPHKDVANLTSGLFKYGMPEINKQQISGALRIANPGCYPTSVLIPLAPLLENNLIESDIIADSKSGHSGAGKKLSESLHAGQITGNIQPYKVLNHQHKGEISQGIKKLSGEDQISLTFTPQLADYDRGILSNIYVKLKKDIDEKDLNDLVESRFKDHPFVRIFKSTKLQSLKMSQHTNYCDISYSLDRETGRITVISTIDNLIKGASGQAVQNMNVALGLPEKRGLNV